MVELRELMLRQHLRPTVPNDVRMVIGGASLS
jgi:hypothetical protein